MLSAPEPGDRPLGADPLVSALLARCTFPDPGVELTCAVSGGADSSALLVLAVAAGCRATAVHVDHGLRPGSAAEAGRVAALAQRLNARALAVTAPVAPGANLEARARAARLAALPADAAFGHTADDQAETVLVNLMRGAAVDGLAGMRPGHRHPLLALRRADTVELCRRLGIDVVVDPSNADPRFLRNRVRAELLPLLADLAGRDPVPIVARQADHLRSAAELIDGHAAELDPTDVRALAAAPRALAAAALRLWLRPALGGHPPDSAALARVLDVVHGRSRATEVAGGLRVARRQGRLRLEGPSTRPAVDPSAGPAVPPEDPAPPTGREVCQPQAQLPEPDTVGAVPLPVMAPKGKWAAGIVPRNFSWVIKERLAVCERPGGYGTNHRRVRRQEEIIWIREQGFTCVISVLPSPHNLHNYDELGMPWVHRPYSPGEGSRECIAALYPQLRDMLASGGRIVVHRNELGDPVVGLMAGYLAWSGMVPDGPRAISIIEQITHRQLGPVGRNLVGLALEQRDAGGVAGSAGPAPSTL